MTTTAKTRERLYITVTPEQKAFFEDEAKRLGKTRSALIADAALRQIKQTPVRTELPSGRYVLTDCVNDIARRYSGIPRTQLVGMVSAVIRKLSAM